MSTGGIQKRWILKGRKGRRWFRRTDRPERVGCGFEVCTTREGAWCPRTSPTDLATSLRPPLPVRYRGELRSSPFPGEEERNDQNQGLLEFGPEECRDLRVGINQRGNSLSFFLGPLGGGPPAYSPRPASLPDQGPVASRESPLIRRDPQRDLLAGTLPSSAIALF